MTYNNPEFQEENNENLKQYQSNTTHKNAVTSNVRPSSQQARKKPILPNSNKKNKDINKLNKLNDPRK